MKMIPPKTPEILASSVPEDDAPLYAASVAYAEGETCIVEHRVYTSLKADNKGHYPPENVSGVDAWWRDMGPTNRWRALDAKISTQTVAPEGETELSFTLSFSRCTGFAVLNVSATEFEARVVKTGRTAPVFDRVYKMRRGVTSYYGFFFDRYRYKKDIVQVDVPLSSRSEITLVFRYAQGPAVGHIVVGRVRDIGATLYDVSAGIQSYSRVETDDFGDTTIVVRPSAKLYSGKLYVHPGKFDEVYQLLSDQDGKPALWMGDNRSSERGGLQALTAFGLMNAFNMPVVGPNEANVNFEIKGLQ